ncbi:MAG: trimethylamine methyltransferase family protein [Eubacteriales bacterium]|nr:trimethylamine methyltransferase family protein [Eubacteriales bacterium]
MLGRIKYDVLNQAELELFKDRVQQLLSKRGIILEHEALKDELEKAGCIVKRKHVYFPEEVIERALSTVPKEFTFYAPDEKYNMKFPNEEGRFYTRTCTGGMNYLPVEGEKHLVNFDDVREWYHLTNQLENISFVALPSTCEEGVPAEVIDVYTLEQALLHSKKHIWIQPYEGANVKHLIRMCQEVAGGAEELKEKPFVSFISCSVPVLKFKNMDAEIIYQCGKAGIPVQPCSLPTAGANTPVTAQGTALAACADVLAQIIMLQILCPGLPVIATTLLFSLDMKTTATLQSNTEITFGRLICMQVFEQGYGIRCHSYGTGTDSFHVDDGQNYIERTSLIHMMAMSDASVLGGAGQLETALTISPLQLIIDNEIFGMARRLRKGLAVDDETLDFEELLAGKDKSGYLMSDHTMAHFKEMHRQELFFKGTVEGRDDANLNMMERVHKKYKELMANPREVVLGEALQKKVHEIVLEAEKDLISK